MELSLEFSYRDRAITKKTKKEKKKEEEEEKETSYHYFLYLFSKVIGALCVQMQLICPAACSLYHYDCFQM